MQQVEVDRVTRRLDSYLDEDRGEWIAPFPKANALIIQAPSNPINGFQRAIEFLDDARWYKPPGSSNGITHPHHIGNR